MGNTNIIRFGSIPEKLVVWMRIPKSRFNLFLKILQIYPKHMWIYFKFRYILDLSTLLISANL
jgi:hypothetical protein